MVDYLGWIATAVFVASYFYAKPAALRAVQMIGSVIWVIYGILIGASPVVAANVLVFAAAAWTTVGAFKSLRLTHATQQRNAGGTGADHQRPSSGSVMTPGA